MVRFKRYIHNGSVTFLIKRISDAIGDIVETEVLDD